MRSVGVNRGEFRMQAHHRKMLPFALAVLATCLFPGMVRAASDAHGVDMMPVLAALVVILVGARLGGALVAAAGQPAVLGELLVGVLLGNLGLVGFHGFEPVHSLVSVQVLAQIGVLFLLFNAGLESDLAEMKSVGRSALLVALIGVVVPIALGFVLSRVFFPSHSILSHLFVGAVLCATSVGITARVLTDLGRLRSMEGRIIIGAAVVDDILGLVVLAVIVGLVKASDAGEPFRAWSVAAIVAKAAVFLFVALLVGRKLSAFVFRFASRMNGEGLLLTGALAFCFGLSYLAGLAGLAPIVGAFAAGLILDETHYQILMDKDAARRSVKELLEPLATFLVPVFFVLMGMQVDLRVFSSPGVLTFAAMLTVVAVFAKQSCAIGVLERGADKWTVGLGMIPRGEVGLIFAGVGSTLTIAGERVVDGAVFSAAVAMVALTTLATPPLLGWRIRKQIRLEAGSR